MYIVDCDKKKSRKQADYPVGLLTAKRSLAADSIRAHYEVDKARD
jgi:hypothetical protein